MSSHFPLPKSWFGVVTGWPEVGAQPGTGFLAGRHAPHTSWAAPGGNARSPRSAAARSAVL